MKRILVIFCLCVLSGCGYNQSNSPAAQQNGYQWKSLYREDINTIAVPIFKNKDFERGVEFNLTQAIVQQIEQRTPYKVVGKDRADTILEGEIVEITRSTVSNDARAAIPQEQLFIVRVNFLWKDLRSGKILTERRNFEQSATYYPTLGEGQFIGTQQNVEKLALGIVQELQADW